MNDTKNTINDTKNTITEQPKKTLHPLFDERTIISDFRYFDQKKHTLVCVNPLFYVCVHM